MLKRRENNNQIVDVTFFLKLPESQTNRLTLAKTYKPVVRLTQSKQSFQPSPNHNGLCCQNLGMLLFTNPVYPLSLIRSLGVPLVNRLFSS